MKDVRGRDMCSEEGEIRLLFATEAFSMGADATGIQRVIHAGPPNTIESLYPVILHILFTAVLTH